MEPGGRGSWCAVIACLSSCGQSGESRNPGSEDVGRGTIQKGKEKAGRNFGGESSAPGGMPKGGAPAVWPVLRLLDATIARSTLGLTDDHCHDRKRLVRLIALLSYIRVG